MSIYIVGWLLMFIISSLYARFFPSGEWFGPEKLSLQIYLCFLCLAPIAFALSLFIFTFGTAPYYLHLFWEKIGEIEF